MSMQKTLTVMSCGFALLLGVASQVQAGGLPSPPVCQVPTNNALGGANITGSVVITYSNVLGSSADVDATLRLRYGSKEDVFRAHVDGAALLSPEEVLCQILQSNVGQGPLNPMGQSILNAFSLGATSIKFNNKALTGVAEGVISGTTGLPGGAHKSALAEVTLYPQ